MQPPDLSVPIRIVPDDFPDMVFSLKALTYQQRAAVLADAADVRNNDFRMFASMQASLCAYLHGVSDGGRPVADVGIDSGFWLTLTPAAIGQVFNRWVDANTLSAEEKKASPPSPPSSKKSPGTVPPQPAS